MAIQKSSNIYFARLVERLISRFSEKWYRDALVEVFGFSKKTQIELPGESEGFVPTIGKLYQNNAPEWSKFTPYSLSRGYNILVNSLQIVRAFSIIANDGMEVRPTILKKIVKKVDGKDQVIVDNTLNDKFDNRRRILSRDSCRIIKTAMKFTTKSGGTSILGDVEGYTEGGKSGTAEKNFDGVYLNDKHISSFIGMVPAMSPCFVLLVVVDEPETKFVPGLGKLQHGGVCAAPIFKEIAARALKYLGVAPDDPFGYSSPNSRRNPEQADWYKEVRCLSDLYKSWNEK